MVLKTRTRRKCARSSSMSSSGRFLFTLLGPDRVLWLAGNSIFDSAFLLLGSIGREILRKVVPQIGLMMKCQRTIYMITRNLPI